LENTGIWNKQKTLATARGYQALVAVDKCMPVTANVKIQMLENIYAAVCVGIE
jgi:hypothetical protein